MWWLIIVGAVLCLVSIYLLTPDKEVFLTILKIIFFPITLLIWIVNAIKEVWDDKQTRKLLDEHKEKQEKRDIENMVERVQRRGITYREKEF